MSLYLSICKGREEGGGVVFAGGREMNIFSTVFQDFVKDMVGKQYFEH